MVEQSKEQGGERGRGEQCRGARLKGELDGGEGAGGGEGEGRGAAGAAMGIPGLDGVAVEPGEEDEGGDGGEQWDGAGGASPDGDDAGEGEDDGDEEFFWRKTGGREMGGDEAREAEALEEWPTLVGGVDSGKVEERGEGQQEIAAEGGGGHVCQDEGERDEDGCHGEGQEKPAMTPVEVVAGLKLSGGGAGIEEAVGEVDGPAEECEDEGNPEREGDACGFGEGEGPDDGNGGRVEAGEVPEVQQADRPEPGSGRGDGHGGWDLGSGRH